MTRILKGFSGHPLHPPLTDMTIGAYTFATVAGVVGAFGGLKEATAKLMLLGLAGGLISTLATATTGFVDWLELDWGTPLWRTATWHMLVMLTATALFLVAALLERNGYISNTVEPIALGVTLLGFVGLTVGGWLGGAIVFVYGMRVLKRENTPALSAVMPGRDPE